MKWFKALNSNQLSFKDGNKVIELNGRKICLIFNDGNYYATALKCPHAGASLEYARLEDDYLVCPIHRHKYNLKTGRSGNGEGECLNIYDTELKLDGLYIGFEENCWSKLFG